MPGVDEQNAAEIINGTIENVVYYNDGNDYSVLEILTDSGLIITAVGTVPIPFEGESVPLRPGMNDCLLVDMMIGGQAKSCYIDTGAAYSYLCGLDKNRFEPVGIADECDLRDRCWTAPVFRVPCELAGHSFEIVCGAASDNKAGVPPDGVIGYDFFNSFTVLLNLREMRLTFKPAGK